MFNAKKVVLKIIIRGHCTTFFFGFIYKIYFLICSVCCPLLSDNIWNLIKECLIVEHWIPPEKFRTWFVMLSSKCLYAKVTKHSLSDISKEKKIVWQLNADNNRISSVWLYPAPKWCVLIKNNLYSSGVSLTVCITLLYLLLPN